LSEDNIPKRIRLRLHRDKDAAGGKNIPQAGKAGCVELQARTGIYCQNDVEGRPVQAFAAIRR
jgi:hypothetical protein